MACSGWRGPPCQFAIDVTIRRYDRRAWLWRPRLCASQVFFISGLRMRSADKKKLSAGLQVSKIDKA